MPSKPDAPIFPKASAEKRESDAAFRRMSALFHALLVEAKLTKACTGDKNRGKCHSVKRTVSALSFQCLRHNTAS
jgi:hypothetical protein